MDLRTLRDLDVAGHRVLTRVDFNVPLADGQVTDDTRIRATLPTIQQLRERGAKTILVSHLGRPRGEPRDDLRLQPVAARLQSLLGAPVRYVRDIVGAEAQAMARDLEAGEVGLLENVRFELGEERNDPSFSKALASLADCYVNDAFGAAHRAHASTVGVAEYLPAAAGLLMEHEVAALSKVLEAPERPYALILGGAKVSDKVGVIEHLLERVDLILIGGGMANTFLKARDVEIGKSLVEDDKLDIARNTMKRADQRGVELLLPIDVVVSPRLGEDSPGQVVPVNQIPTDQAIYDIGQETVSQFADALKSSKTIVWNGPMGVFEVKQYAAGTRGVAEAVAISTGYTLVGGGDSVAAIEELGLADRVDHISTGGGASLEFLEGKELPGVAVLRRNP